MSAFGSEQRSGPSTSLGYEQAGQPRSMNARVPTTLHRAYLMRTAERVDRLFPEWLHECFDANSRYSTKDLNEPVKLLVRRGGRDDYRNDGPLTELGCVAAQLAGRRLRSLEVQIEHVYVSPALRCVQTAAQLMAAYRKDGLRMCVEPGLFEALSWYQRDGLPRFVEPRDLALADMPVDVSYRPVVSVDELRRWLYSEQSPMYTYERVGRVARHLVERANKGAALIVGHGVTLDAGGRALIGRSTPRRMKQTDMQRLGLHYPYGSVLALGQAQADGRWKLLPGKLTPVYTVMDLSNAVDLDYFGRSSVTPYAPAG